MKNDGGFPVRKILWALCMGKQYFNRARPKATLPGDMSQFAFWALSGLRHPLAH
jgi:hypothetical protein